MRTRFNIPLVSAHSRAAARGISNPVRIALYILSFCEGVSHKDDTAYAKNMANSNVKMQAKSVHVTSSVIGIVHVCPRYHNTYILMNLT